MRIKKNPKADLEARKTNFFLAGLLATMCLIWLAFNARQSGEGASKLGELVVMEEVEEIADITKQNQPPPPPPPPPTQIEVVADDKEVEDNTLQETEVTQETKVEPIRQVEEEVEKTSEEEIFMVVEENPEFPGGVKKMYEFIGKNLQYPPLARENNIQGKIVVNFVVDKDGSITNVKVVSKPLGWGCEEEAIRVVKMMPKWKPGMQRNKPVRVSYNLPIKFQLN